MSAYCLFNGNLIEPINAPSLIDRSGLVETILWADGRMPLLNRHLERLGRGLHELDLPPDHISESSVFEAAQILTRNNKVQGFARIRIVILLDPSDILFECYPLSENPLNQLRGLHVELFKESHIQSSSRSRFKQLNSQVHNAARKYQEATPVDELLLRNENDNIVEGSRSNVFVWDGDKIATPPLSEGCVGGIMRDIVFEIANQEKLEVVEASIESAVVPEEMWLTNAIRGVRWIEHFGKLQLTGELAVRFQKSVRLRLRI